MNGVGYPQTDTIIEEYDELGRLTKQTDARQTETIYEYDEQTSARNKMIQDAGGLGLETTYEVDELGRVTAEIGPSHQAGRNGTAIHSMTRTRYLDDENTVWTWQGYRTVGTRSVDVLINPVSITVFNKDDQTVDKISSTQGDQREHVGDPDDSVKDQGQLGSMEQEHLPIGLRGFNRTVHRAIEGESFVFRHPSSRRWRLRHELRQD